MSLIGKIQTLFSDKEKTIPVFPRTKVKAVSDDNGIGLNAILDEMNTATSNAQSTANTAQSTANNAMPKSGGNFTGTVYLQPWQGVSTKVGDANNTDIRFYVDTNGHAVLAVFQNGSWVRTLFEADMNGNYHQGILMPKSGGRFTGGISFIPNEGVWFSINDSLQYQLVGNEWGLHLQKWVNNEWVQEVLTVSGTDGIEIYQNGGANGSGWNFKNISVVKSDWSDVGSKTACIRMLRK